MLCHMYTDTNTCYIFITLELFICYYLCIIFHRDGLHDKRLSSFVLSRSPRRIIKWTEYLYMHNVNSNISSSFVGSGYTHFGNESSIIHISNQTGTKRTIVFPGESHHSLTNRLAKTLKNGTRLGARRVFNVRSHF